jgi:eukaryotic-like serine/threonine-protein kinase
MGVVYLGHDPQIDRPVALKVLRADKVVSEEFVERFLKEARAIGRLTHPNIVVVYDVGRDHGTIYIAMEYLEGSTFTDLIRSGRPDYATWIQVGAELAETLAYAHDKGIIHRDIKPSNIIVSKDMRVKLTDFGIARVEDPAATSHTQVGAILGTPSYMSPEQIAGRRVDGRSDLFSLGVVLYEWLLGQKPFKGANITAIFHAISDRPPTPPTELDPGLPQPLSDLLLKTLQKPAENRFCDGHQMATALRDSLKSTLPLGLRTRSKAHPKKRGAKLIGGGILLFALLTGAVFYGTPQMMSYFRSTGQSPQPTTVTPAPREVAGRESAPAPAPKPSAGLRINSEPAGARIFINNDFKGTTPAELALPLGDYKIRILLADHHDWEARVELSEPGLMPLFVKLTPK